MTRPKKWEWLDHMNELKELERILGYEFKNRELLLTALTHRSYANENRGAGAVCNERLEFLGDSILGMSVARYLYKEFPNMPEGEMTRLRAELVCERSLFEASKKIRLGDFIRLGKGEESGNGRSRPSILADAVEAIIAALYLDGGKDHVHAFILKFILSSLDEKNKLRDYKTALQELIQRKSGNQLSYNIISESGPDHCKQFEAEVLLNGARIGVGSGKSKKEAEQEAAKNALSDLDNEA